jgi:hypothetical protein
MAITIDNRAHVHGRERDSKDRTSGRQFCKTDYSAPSALRSNYSTASTAPKVDDGGVHPMEIDVSHSRGPLSDDTKAHCHKHNLCMWCGKAGHYADNCLLNKNLKPKIRKLYRTAMTHQLTITSPNNIPLGLGSGNELAQNA